MGTEQWVNVADGGLTEQYTRLTVDIWMESSGHAYSSLPDSLQGPGKTHLAASFMPQSSEQYLEPGWAARTQPGPRHCGSDAGSLASALSGCFHLSLCFCFCRCRLYLSSF